MSPYLGRALLHTEDELLVPHPVGSPHLLQLPLHHPQVLSPDLDHQVQGPLVHAGLAEVDGVYAEVPVDLGHVLHEPLLVPGAGSGLLLPQPPLQLLNLDPEVLQPHHLRPQLGLSQLQPGHGGPGLAELGDAGHEAPHQAGVL